MLQFIKDISFALFPASLYYFTFGAGLIVIQYEITGEWRWDTIKFVLPLFLLAFVLGLVLFVL